MKLEDLLQRAREAAEFAYAPYSKFRVGAALLGLDGTVYTGCNVENRSFGLTICAERSALVQGVSRGERRFSKLAISAPDSSNPVGPCGACRQVLSEFMEPSAEVIFGGASPERVITSIRELLPFDSLHNLCC
ncbi:MAG: cytidine deaminase [Spirochaetaceae bacterium]|nr:cytidine deaminase [Spirochaetaceae bacterium]